MNSIGDAGEAIKDIPDGDWAKTQNDLIDRLDEYLHGVQLG